MLQTDNVGQVDLTVLAKCCAAETRKFWQGLLSDTQYCYELFRRALADKNQQAYAKVVEIYSRSMDKRIRKKVRFSLVDEDLEECLNSVFANFFRNLSKAEQFANFPNLEQVLAYLLACANSAAETLNRKQRRMQKREVEVVDIEERQDRIDIERFFLEEEARQKFHALILAHCKSTQERVVFDGYVELGLKPRDIYARHPELFADVKQVQRVKQILLERLQRLLQQYKEDLQ